MEREGIIIISGVSAASHPFDGQFEKLMDNFNLDGMFSVSTKMPSPCRSKKMYGAESQPWGY